MSTAPSLALRAFGLSPKGDPAKTPSYCCQCGILVEQNQLCAPFRPSGSYTDHDIVLRDDPTHLCGACAALSAKPIILAMGGAVISAAGAFPLFQLVHRAWFLATPPEPPFVAMVATAKQQHLVWRTPITRSKDYIQLRVGARMMPIRRGLAMTALEICKNYDGRYRARAKEAGQKTLPTGPIHPFERLSSRIDVPTLWRLRQHHVPGLSASEVLTAPEKRVLLALQPGEFWALAILTAGVTPEAPKPITIKFKP